MSSQDLLYSPNTSLGSRFEGDKGFLFKIGVTGLLMIDPDPEYSYVDKLIWPKLGFGKTF